MDLGQKFQSKEKVFKPVFHGTGRQTWLAIERAGFIVRKGRPGQAPGYLGHGVYFYEGSAADAFRWATINKNLDDPVVVEASVEAAKCIDFCDGEVVETLEKHYRNWQKRMNAVKKNSSEPYFFNWLTECMPDIDCIRAAQRRPALVGKRDNFWLSKFESIQLVICVKRVEIIKVSGIHQKN